MSGTTPSACVVVSTYERSALLPDLIEALRAQTARDLEVVVVDDGSTDQTHAELIRLTQGDPRFRVIRSPENRGPARGRNLGWRSTEADWVAFTDDDCLPEPGWLDALLDAGRHADVVQGRTVPADLPPGRRAGWFDRSQQIESWSGRFQTCNLLVARTLLEDLTGFDERLAVMGEDTDLGLRAVAAGARTTFEPRAVVAHIVWPAGLQEYLRQRRRYATTVGLVRANPAARQLLRWGFVLRGVHLLVWALVPLTAAAIVTSAPWLPLVPMAAWVALNTRRTRYRPFPLHARIGYSALHLVAYAYEAGCFAAASIRHRALVI